MLYIWQVTLSPSSGIQKAIKTFLFCSKYKHKITFFFFILKSWLWKHPSGTLLRWEPLINLFIYLFFVRVRLFPVQWELRLGGLTCRHHTFARNQKEKLKKEKKKSLFTLPRNDFPPGNRTGGTRLPRDAVTTRKTNVEPTWVAESGWQINMLGLNFPDQWMVAGGWAGGGDLHIRGQKAWYMTQGNSRLKWNGCCHKLSSTWHPPDKAPPPFPPISAYRGARCELPWERIVPGIVLTFFGGMLPKARYIGAVQAHLQNIWDRQPVLFHLEVCPQVVNTL